MRATTVAILLCAAAACGTPTTPTTTTTPTTPTTPVPASTPPAATVPAPTGAEQAVADADRSMVLLEELMDGLSGSDCAQLAAAMSAWIGEHGAEVASLGASLARPPGDDQAVTTGLYQDEAADHELGDTWEGYLAFLEIRAIVVWDDHAIWDCEQDPAMTAALDEVRPLQLANPVWPDPLD